MRVVERQQVSRFLGGVLQCFLELHSHAAAAAFRSDFGARMVDKNLAHDRGGEIKEVRLVLSSQRRIDRRVEYRLREPGP